MCTFMLWDRKMFASGDSYFSVNVEVIPQERKPKAVDHYKIERLSSTAKSPTSLEDSGF